MLAETIHRQGYLPNASRNFQAPRRFLKCQQKLSIAKEVYYMLAETIIRKGGLSHARS